jgi:hypothetical protein
VDIDQEENEVNIKHEEPVDVDIGINSTLEEKETKVEQSMQWRLEESPSAVIGKIEDAQKLFKSENILFSTREKVGNVFDDEEDDQDIVKAFQKEPPPKKQSNLKEIYGSFFDDEQEKESKSNEDQKIAPRRSQRIRAQKEQESQGILKI